MLNAVIRSRVEPEVRDDATRILKESGLDISTAIRMFLRGIITANGMPFDVRPNAETVAAIKESRSIKKARFESADELFRDLEEKGTTSGKRTKKAVSTKGTGSGRTTKTVRTTGQKVSGKKQHAAAVR